MSAHYERLSYLDTSFLALESRTTHMHVAGLSVFETGTLRTASGGVDVDAIRRFVASKLHLIPRYRQRLAHVPVERAPVWVDDEHFNIDYHVRHTSLPRPGSFDQLTELMGRLSSQQLDRSKPLWEMWIVEGLEDDRFAVISKIHHCMIDGMASVALMAVLLNLAPTDAIDDPEPFVPRPVPNGVELMVRETARRTGRVLSAVQNARSLVDDAQSLAMEGARRVRAMGASLNSGWLSTATKTPLNGDLGPNRRFASAAIDLDGVKTVKNALGGSVNDVVLATVAGGVRTFLTKERGFDVNGADFRVMAPVSVRSSTQRGELGNQVAMWLAGLPIADADPAARLAAVTAETTKLKQTDQALGASTLVRLSAGAPTTLVSMASRLATGARPFNMTVTNVPGPQFPVYLLGAKMVEQYPLVPLWHGHGVGIAVFSYMGKMYWGINADYDLMPDLDAFADAQVSAFSELLDAATTAAKPAAAPSTAQPRKAKKRPPLGTPSGGATAAGTSTKATAKKPAATTKKTAASKTSTAKKTAAKTTTARATTAKKPATKKPAAKAASTKASTAKKAAATKKPATKSSAKTTAAAKKTQAATKRTTTTKKAPPAK